MQSTNGTKSNEKSSQKNNVDGNSIFVRGLAASTTGEQLESLFSGVGPVRRSFVVTNGTPRRCTGVGFVHFALQEDAAKALKVLQGVSLGGRRIRLDYARRRQRKTDSVTGDDEPRSKSTPQNKGIQKENKKPSSSVASRTVVVKARSEAATVDVEAVLEKLGENPTSVGYESSVSSTDGTSLRLLFRSWPQAGAAAARVNGAEFDACVDALRGGRKCRLIVRNLPFKLSLSKFRSIFEQLAAVREFSFPQSNSTNLVIVPDADDDKLKDEEIQCRGFGFVEYFLAADANRAVKKVNETTIGGRMVAVDLAIGKSSFLQKNTGNHEKEDEQDEEEHGEGPSGKVDASSNSDNDSGGDENTSADESVEYTGKKAESTDEEMERTVFVRNLLFETSTADLRKAMEERFGSVEQAVLVKDPVTSRPRGSAFVRFTSVEQALSAASGNMRTKEHRSGAERTGGVMKLQGRELLIVAAVRRERARDLVAGSNCEKGKADRRNMRLAWIGHIKPDSEEARGLSEADIGKRTKAAKEKKAKLASNPNAFVSETRLCIRNLPKFADEKFLKQMCLSILRLTRKDVSSSPPKVTHVKIVRDAGRNDRSRGFGFVQFEEHRHALQALHLLNNDPKVLETVIEARPAALEIDDAKAHEYRQWWGKERRLIVEFSVEDSRTVALLNKIKEKGKAMKQSKQESEADSAVDDKNSKKRNRREHKNIDGSSTKSATKNQKTKRRKVGKKVGDQYESFVEMYKAKI